MLTSIDVVIYLVICGRPGGSRVDHSIALRSPDQQMHASDQPITPSPDQEIP
jgi:hypothetical protein